MLDSRSLAFAEEVLRLTDGHGVELVLNSLADEFVGRSFAVVARGGRFLEIGKRGIWTREQVAALNRDVEYHIVDWGVDAQKNPALIGAMFQELAAEFAGGRLQPLPRRVFPWSEAVAAFRFMAQGRHTGKVVVSQRELLGGAVSGAPVTISADATYLITGGLSGLGLLVGEWLVGRGARQLVLAGRRAPTPEAAAVIQSLEQRGARVRVATTDVSDGAALAALLADVRATMPPLKGIIHSAGVLDDAALPQQNWERFRRVFAPKVAGSFQLHTLTRSDALDFFVLFSSVAALLGSPGQANHAAANSFMDVLARSRRALSLPAVSINWGAWSEVGAATCAGLS